MIRGLFGIGLVFALLVGCEKHDQPQEPVWNKQACAYCQMLLSDPRYAAQLVTTQGDRYYFDDIGCMVSYLAERKPTLALGWVRDSAGHWVDARSAHYARGAKTPMDHGYAPNHDGALGFADLEREIATKRGAGAEE